MNKNTYTQLSDKYLVVLNSYIQTRSHEHQHHQTARDFLTKMDVQCSSDDAYRVIVGDWLENGSTIKLMSLLRVVSYDPSNLDQFNAMALMDSARIKFGESLKQKDQPTNKQVDLFEQEPEAEKVKEPEQVLEVKPMDSKYIGLLSEYAQRARNAHNNTSFSPEKRGEQMISDYEKQLSIDLDSITAATEQQQTDYLAKYKRLFSDYLAAKSRCISSMITGPSNFPVARAQKFNQWESNKYDTFQGWRKRALPAIQKSIQAAKSPEQKIDEAWVSIKKHIVEAAATIISIDTGEETRYSRPLFVNSITNFIKRMAKNGQAEHVKRSLELIKDINNKYDKPIVTNKSAIWGLVAVAEEIEADQEAETNRESETIPFDGGKIVLNYQQDRLQIVHEQKPDDAVRSELKRNGFRWSPRNTAWQRKLTNAAKYKAQELTGVEIK